MSIDYDKIRCLREQIAGIRKKLSVEKDAGECKRLQLQIKICELKILVANVN